MNQPDETLSGEQLEVELATIEDGEFAPTGETIVQSQTEQSDDIRAIMADQEPYELDGFGD